MSVWKNLTGTIFAVTIGLVAVFMLVGGVVIMNIMLASVTERTHEIGIRKSLGARRRDILWQFVLESGMMAAMGGVAGVLLAVGIAARGRPSSSPPRFPCRRWWWAWGFPPPWACSSASTPPAKRPCWNPSRRSDRRSEDPCREPIVQNIRENLLLALDTLRTHKFRSFLTVLGVLIGTTTVIAVTSIIAGLDKQLVDVAEQFGTRTLWVYKLQVGAPHILTREERLRRASQLRRRHGHQGAVALDRNRFRGVVSRTWATSGLPPVTARYKGQDMLDALFVGVTADHLRLINATLGQGRFFTEADDCPPPRRGRNRARRRGAVLRARGSRGQDHSGGRAQPGDHRHAQQIQVVPGRRSRTTRPS